MRDKDGRNIKVEKLHSVAIIKKKNDSPTPEDVSIVEVTARMGRKTLNRVCLQDFFNYQVFFKYRWHANTVITLLGSLNRK